jgi:hypothetical protein
MQEYFPRQGECPKNKGFNGDKIYIRRSAGRMCRDLEI